MLTSKACSKRVLHVAFDVAGSGMRFAAGDSFTVHPANDRELVRGLLEHLGANGSQCALFPASLRMDSARKGCGLLCASKSPGRMRGRVQEGALRQVERRHRHARPAAAPPPQAHP